VDQVFRREGRLDEKSGHVWKEPILVKATEVGSVGKCCASSVKVTE
jgi:hypothetical protein